MTTLSKTLAAAILFALAASQASAEDIIAVRISPPIDGQIALTTLVAAPGSEKDCEHVQGVGLKARMNAVYVGTGKPAGPPRSACWYIDKERDQIVVHTAAERGRTMVFKYPVQEFTSSGKPVVTR